MLGKEDRIYFPATLSELHNLIKSGGATPFYSGRMYPIKEAALEDSYPLPPTLINLDGIEELKKISRSETYIDCGSIVSLTALFNKAGHLLPPLLIRTLQEAYNPAQLYLTTPAGIIYSGKFPTPVSLLLNIMEVSYEIRRLKMHNWRGISAVNHWMFHNQLFQKGKIDLKAGDILLRMRLPSNTWGKARMERIQLGKKTVFLAMTSEINRNYIADFRFSYAFDGGELFREREREAHISGRNINSSAKETELLAKAAAEKLGFTGEDKLIRAIYNSIRNFLYQSREVGA
jgi:hypothetical protein